MNKKQIIKKAGGVYELAALLVVTRQAVESWGDKLPPLRIYQLKELRPEWFVKGKK